MPPQSTRKGAVSKPPKPYPDFPLFPHATRRWAKKIRGKFHYFGPWTNEPDRGASAALARYQEQASDLHAGRTPRSTPEGLTLRELCNRFLTFKRDLLDNEEISPRTWADYHATCERIIRQFGRERLVDDLAAGDFREFRVALAKVRGPVSLGNEIQRVRTVFKFGYDEGLIDRPVRYGPAFKRPHKRVLRKHRHSNGPKMFEAKEIRAMIAAAGGQLEAMILLGINCGFGNADCAGLPVSALDLDAGWCDYPRPKTGIPRRCPLWPETVEALRRVIATRPEPNDKGDSGLVFITKYGHPWGKKTSDNPISKEMAKLLEKLGTRRKGVGFYALRHGFETVGGDSRDQVAVDHIMGHANDDMATIYRERISDERLTAVTDHVRAWLLENERT